MSIMESLLCYGERDVLKRGLPAESHANGTRRSVSCRRSRTRSIAGLPRCRLGRCRCDVDEVPRRYPLAIYQSRHGGEPNEPST